MTASPGRLREKKAIACGALGIAAALSMASMRACDALLPALSSDFAIPVGVAAQSISAFVLAYGFLQLLYGPLGDRYGRLRVISAALAPCSMANVMAAMAPSMTFLALARGLSGAAAAGIIPLSMARIGDTVPIEKRQQIRAVLSERWARLILLVTVVEGLFTLAGFAFVPAYLHRRFGIGIGASGAVMVMYGGGGLAYVTLSSVLIRRFSLGGLAGLGGALLGSAFAIVAGGSRWEWSVLGCFVGGLGFYMLHNTLQTEATQMVPQARGTAVGLFAASLFFGQAIGMALAAVLIDSFGETSLFCSAAVALPLLAFAFGKLGPG